MALKEFFFIFKLQGIIAFPQQKSYFQLPNGDIKNRGFFQLDFFPSKIPGKVCYLLIILSFYNSRSCWICTHKIIILGTEKPARAAEQARHNLADQHIIVFRTQSQEILTWSLSCACTGVKPLLCTSIQNTVLYRLLIWPTEKKKEKKEYLSNLTEYSKN